MPPPVAWAWHSHEDKADDNEGEVSVSWADVGMAGVVVAMWGLDSVLTSSPQALTANQAPGSPEDSEVPSLISLPSLPQGGKKRLGQLSLRPGRRRCTSLDLFPFLEGGPRRD